MLNHVSHLALPMCCIAKKRIFGACVELHLSFRTVDELHCKKTLVFGACDELRL